MQSVFSVLGAVASGYTFTHMVAGDVTDPCERRRCSLFLQNGVSSSAVEHRQSKRQHSGSKRHPMRHQHGSTRRGTPLMRAQQGRKRYSDHMGDVLSASHEQWARSVDISDKRHQGDIQASQLPAPSRQWQREPGRARRLRGAFRERDTPPPARESAKPKPWKSEDCSNSLCAQPTKCRPFLLNTSHFESSGRMQMPGSHQGLTGNQSKLGRFQRL